MRGFQEVYTINPTQAPWPLGLGFGLVHDGDITGPLLAPNGGSNGLDPFYATAGEHAQTLNTPGPMAPGDFGEGSGGSGTSSVNYGMGGVMAAAAAQSGSGSTNPDSVQHAPPEKAAPPDCDCHCGDEEGTHYLDQTSDMVGEVHGDTVTRGPATRSLEDVQEWDELNPNLTPEGWDEFFALGENAAQHRQDLIDKLTKLRGIYKEVLGDLAQPGLTKSNLKLLDNNRRNAYERIREVELELGILGQTALMTLANNLLADDGTAISLWTAVTNVPTSTWQQMAEVAVSAVPIVGEAMDVAVILDPYSPLWQKGFAGWPGRR